jgi:hypothetical protein
MRRTLHISGTREKEQRRQKTFSNRLGRILNKNITGIKRGMMNGFIPLFISQLNVVL